MGKIRILLYTFLAIAAGGALSLLLLNQFYNSVPKSPVVHPLLSTPQKELFKTTAHLYFADKEKPFLIAEERDLLHAEDAVSFAKMIVTALSEGPRQELMRTLPSETVLRALFIDQNKTAYVDFNESLKENHPGGSHAEILTIYAIVNSLVLNIPGIETAKILFDGRESMTLSGHMDLRFPMKANMLLVR
ncbi:MAG: GerMN domain-containing protein [Desulfobacterales bacterium]|nr:GerMN domain-containing protein [Desulfobacterales bacterium]